MICSARATPSSSAAWSPCSARPSNPPPGCPAPHTHPRQLPPPLPLRPALHLPRRPGLALQARQPTRLPLSSRPGLASSRARPPTVQGPACLPLPPPLPQPTQLLPLRWVGPTVLLGKFLRLQHQSTRNQLCLDDKHLSDDGKIGFPPPIPTPLPSLPSCLDFGEELEGQVR